MHIYFPQAAPLKSYIDAKQVPFLNDKKCQICVGVCEKKAIDLHQKPEKMEIEVGAIILAPGYETFDPGLRGDFGYGKMENVVTSLDFERILCSTGPFEGRDRSALRTASIPRGSPGFSALAPGRSWRAATATVRPCAAPTPRNR